MHIVSCSFSLPATKSPAIPCYPSSCPYCVPASHLNYSQSTHLLLIQPITCPHLSLNSASSYIKLSLPTWLLSAENYFYISRLFTFLHFCDCLFVSPYSSTYLLLAYVCIIVSAIHLLCLWVAPQGTILARWTITLLVIVFSAGGLITCKDEYEITSPLRFPIFFKHFPNIMLSRYFNGKRSETVTNTIYQVL